MADRGQERRQDATAGGADDHGRRPPHVANWLERLVSGISLLLLLAAIAYLTWEGLGPSRPPAFEAEVRQVRETAAGFDVLLAVHNRGGESAQNLMLRARVSDGGTVLAEAETALSWLPASSLRQAAVILPVDPREHTLEIVFLGYELP